jgi:hypothetical protein
MDDFDLNKLRFRPEGVLGSQCLLIVIQLSNLGRLLVKVISNLKGR